MVTCGANRLRVQGTNAILVQTEMKYCSGRSLLALKSFPIFLLHDLDNRGAAIKAHGFIDNFMNLGRFWRALCDALPFEFVRSPKLI
jgi:hypothetical protein